MLGSCVTKGCSALASGLLLVGLLWASAVGAEEGLSANTLRVSERVTLAGELLPQATQQLVGAQTLVVDLRSPMQGASAEARALALAGVDYLSDEGIAGA